MRIIKLQAENFKKIIAIEITPKGNTVVISGANGQGKSSVLDAIWMALEGRAASKTNIKPIRDGERNAKVSLTIDGMVVTRKWTSNEKSYLEITKGDNAVLKTPQAVLDKITGKLSFDPLEFANMKDSEQKAVLLDMLDLPIDLDALDEQREEAYGTRTLINRQIKKIEGHLHSLPLPVAGLPAEEISVSALTQKHSEAVENKIKLSSLKNALASHIERAEQLKEEFANIEQLISTTQEEIDNFVMPDIDEIKTELDNAEDTNRKIRNEKERQKVIGELNEAQMESKKKTFELQGIENTKRDALESAKFPVEGLGFDDVGVVFNGIPFKQCSSSEQLKVSLGIAMAMNPELRVIRITDGSLLDSQSMAVIEEMADDNDFQVWCEQVEESGAVGIYIEDGEVVNDNYQ